MALLIKSDIKRVFITFRPKCKNPRLVCSFFGSAGVDSLMAMPYWLESGQLHGLAIEDNGVRTDSSGSKMGTPEGRRRPIGRL